MTTVLVGITQPTKCRMISTLVTSVGVLIQASSEVQKRSAVFQISSNTMPSVLLLFLGQNEGFAKSQVHKYRAVVDTILQLSCRKEDFEGAKFSYLLAWETDMWLQTATV